MQAGVSSRRLAQLRSTLKEYGVEAIFVSGPYNRHWLSGFTGSTGWLLITNDRALLATDFRYWEQAAAQSPDFELFKVSVTVTPADMVRAAGVQNVALEAQHVTLKEYQLLDAIDGVNWLHSEELVERLRRIKDAGELEKIKAAAAITDEAMACVPELVRVGMTELELAWALEKMMREAGATGLTFPVHVATGPNAALPHHAPGERQIELGDIVLVDMGAAVDGYGSDLTRTYLLANGFDPLFQERYELAFNALQEALAQLQPGKSGREIDAVARNIIGDAGYGEQFGHGLGHGLGLEGHEGPRLSTSSDKTPLAPGMVVTVEPGIYIPGWGGIRIEELVVVTDAGMELLSHCPHVPLLGLP